MHQRSSERKRNRLSYWHYGLPGWYFLTFGCVQGLCLLGTIEAGAVLLSMLGRIAQEELLRSFAIRQELVLDSYIIMPNHLHLIVRIVGTTEGDLHYSRLPGQLEAHSTSSFVSGYKSSVTSRSKPLLAELSLDTVWHRSYHDHVIRSDDSLLAIRQYIMNNPRRWELDRLNPAAKASQKDEIDSLLELDAQRPLPW